MDGTRPEAAGVDRPQRRGIRRRGNRGRDESGGCAEAGCPARPHDAGATLGRDALGADERGQTFCATARFAGARRGKRARHLRGFGRHRGYRNAAHRAGGGRHRLRSVAHLACLPFGHDGSGACAVPCRNGSHATVAATHSDRFHLAGRMARRRGRRVAGLLDAAVAREGEIRLRRIRACREASRHRLARGRPRHCARQTGAPASRHAFPRGGRLARRGCFRRARSVAFGGGPSVVRRCATRCDKAGSAARETQGAPADLSVRARAALDRRVARAGNPGRADCRPTRGESERRAHPCVSGIEHAHRAFFHRRDSREARASDCTDHRAGRRCVGGGSRSFGRADAIRGPWARFARADADVLAAFEGIRRADQFPSTDGKPVHANGAGHAH